MHHIATDRTLRLRNCSWPPSRPRGRTWCPVPRTRAIITDKVYWRWVYTFPCQKLALFVSPFTLPVSPFTERLPLWRWNLQWVHTFRCQKAARRVIENPRQTIKSCPVILGKAEAFPIVREVRSVRDREREIDGSGVTIVAIKLAMSFALFLAKSLHLSIGEEFCTFPCQKFAPSFLLSWLAMIMSSLFPLPKTFHSSEQLAFFVKFALSNGVTGVRSSKKKDRISGCTVLLLIEKMNQINTKNYWK